MYSLNGIALSTWGIIPSQAPGSNLAISGHLDMPARIGEVSHDWGDEDGVEPLVDAEDIRFGGRTIKFYGLIEGDDREDGAALVQALLNYLSTLTDLVPFSSDYGVWQVMVRDRVEIEWIRDGWYRIMLPLWEPIVEMGVGWFDEFFDDYFD